MPDLNQITSQLERQEAWRSKPYWDLTDEPLVLSRQMGGRIERATVAFGRNLNVPLSKDEGLYLLSHDINRAVAELDQHFPAWRKLSEPRQNVLLNMCFNMGWPTLSEFKHMLAAIEAGRFDEVPGHMQASRWFGQVGNRAIELITQFRGDRFQ